MVVPRLLEEELLLELLVFPAGCLTVEDLLVPHETKNKANIKLAKINFIIFTILELS